MDVVGLLLWSAPCRTALHSAGSPPAPLPTIRRACCPLQPFVIVGGGRVGQALADMGAAQGVADALVKRGEGVAGPEGPIVVCTRNDDLQAVVDSTPPERRKGERGQCQYEQNSGTR